MTFKFNYTRQGLERACEEFTEIQKVADNEVCKGWDMKTGSQTFNITKYNDYYRVGDCYHEKILRYFKCRFDGDEITIFEALENGRTLKAEKYLKKYAQCAMRVFALVKCGKLN
jgi:hypothetical protein